MLVWKAIPSITLRMSAMRRTAGDIAHFLNHIADHFAAVIGSIRNRFRQLVRLLGVIRREFHRGGDLFHAGGGAQRGRGGLRALNKIPVSAVSSRLPVSVYELASRTRSTECIGDWRMPSITAFRRLNSRLAGAFSVG